MTGRIKKIMWSPEALVMMSSGTYRVAGNDLPDDTRVTGVCIDGDVFCAYIESQEFPEVHEGMAIECIGPVWIDRIEE